MDQIQPDKISRIVIAPPPFPGARHLRGWSVSVIQRGDERIPNESYGCSDAESALNIATKLLTGEKVTLADCLSCLNETGGRPHAAR